MDRVVCESYNYGDYFMKEIFCKYLKHPDCIFVVVSIFFAMSLSEFAIGSDDAVLITLPTRSDNILFNKNVNFINVIIYNYNVYFTWASRIIVNSIILWLLFSHKLFWMIYMGISLFIIFKSTKLLLLFKVDNTSIAISSICLMVPFSFQISAGWIATTGSYFAPLAFLLLSMVPIKKILCKENFKNYEYVIYVLALVYGTNMEQGSLLASTAYGFMFIYSIYKKYSHRFYIGFMLFLSLLSVLNVILCPGNWARKASEYKWFPTYDMLGVVDKLDIGFFTTIHMIMVKENTLLLTMCLGLAVGIWLKYKITFYRCLSAYPVIVLSLLGPLHNVLLKIDVRAERILKEIPYNGLISVNVGIDERTQFFLFTTVFIAIFIEIVLFHDDIRELIFSYFFLIMGLLSRIMMGFSPTVYASSTRTFELLYLCMAIVAIQVISKVFYENQECFDKWVYKALNSVFVLNIIVSLYQIHYLIKTTFR